MARGIERRKIFYCDEDRNDLLVRLGAATTRAKGRIYAWSLMPNHLHLLLRSGSISVSRVLQSALGGYATAFNRRHRRTGHLFQNRFKSIVVEEETYLLELVRYLHLNPVRAGLVATVQELDRYPWTGHPRLMGSVAAGWQDVAFVLEQFGRTVGQARKAYRAFVEEGWSQGRRPELMGGGLRRSRQMWEAVEVLERGRERWAFDERVLGSSDFVERLLLESDAATAMEEDLTLDGLITRVATRLGFASSELRTGRRLAALGVGRAIVAHVAVCHLGISVQEVAAGLNVTRFTIWRATRSGPLALRDLGLCVQDLLIFPG